MDWNPTNPDVLGLEYSPGLTGTLPATSYGSSTQGVVQSMPSTATESIDEILLFQTNATPDSTAERPTLLEIFAAGNEIASGISTATYRPNGDVSNTGWENEVGGTSNLYASVDESVFNATDYISAVVSSTTSATIRFSFDTAGALTGKRILNVTLTAQAYTEGTSVGKLLVRERTGIYTAARSSQSVDIVGASTYTFDLGEFFQATTDPMPWTINELQGLAAGTHSIALTATGLGSVTLYVYQVYLTVTYCDENRLAVGTIPHVYGASWKTVNMQTPSGGTLYWPKVSGQNFSVCVRAGSWGNASASAYSASDRVHGAAATSVGMPYLQGINYVPTADFALYRDLDFQPASEGVPPTATPALAALNAESPKRAFPIIFRDSGVQSVDSQPYGGSTIAVVQTGETVQQEVSDASAQDYAAAIVTCYPFGTTNVSDVTVSLRQRSDDTEMATGTLTYDAWAESPEVTGYIYRSVVVLFDTPATLAPATQYYLDLSATGSTAWFVPLLWSGQPDANTDANGIGSYGDETDEATVTSASAETDSYAVDNSTELAIQVVAPPDAPTDFDAIAAAYPASTCNCATPIAYTAITWTATALNADFGYYEIQRSDDQTAWAKIAHITTEAAQNFEDQEARLGMQSCYRIRVVTSTGVPSAWTASVCVDTLAPGKGYTFTSNEVISMGVAYGDVYESDPGREYQFPEANEVQFRTMHGRDYQVAFRPLTRRGVTFTRRLLISGLACTNGTEGPDAADALRDLAWATLSYVCVRDESGNRWFASLQIPDLLDRHSAEVHTVTLTATEVTNVPSQPDVDVC